MLTEEEKQFINMTKAEYRKLYTMGQCATCKYKCYVTGGLWICVYCYKEGTRRQSLPPNCNKYIKRRGSKRHKKRIKKANKNV